jgi:uncharacterized protein (TIGR02145 family)
MKPQFCDERDGQKYVYVTIGNQVWMAENLNYDTANGMGSWCYENSPDSCAKYGRLYDWNTAMGGMTSTSANPSNVQGACPAGWHLPSEVEWDVLITEIGGDMEGYTLMTMSGWYKDDYDYDGYGTDEYGFSALPGGGRGSGTNGSFGGVGEVGDWWSATDCCVSLAQRRYIDIFIKGGFVSGGVHG